MPVGSRELPIVSYERWVYTSDFNSELSSISNGLSISTLSESTKKAVFYFFNRFDIFWA